MSIVQLVVVVPAALLRESTTCAVNEVDPAVVGVPVIVPVEEFSVSPAGKFPVMIEKV